MERALGNVVALILLAVGGLFLLDWLSGHMGWQGWLSCRIGAVQLGHEVLQLGAVIAFGLAIIPATRALGIGLFVLGIGGTYGLELLSQTAAGVCLGASQTP